ncbi:MAG: hypothetical protein WAN60_15925, partial [Candidatus Sulfotelmatobacter sp.]
MALDWISMNVISMVHEIQIVTNPVIGKSALPDFSFATEDGSEGMRVSAFDKLNRMFERHVLGGSQQQVDMLGHKNEGMELITTLASMSVEGLQEKARVVLD